MSEAEDNDPVLQELRKVQKVLQNYAIAHGDGPADRRKSEFKSDDDRQSFIAAWGIDVYNRLPD